MYVHVRPRMPNPLMRSYLYVFNTRSQKTLRVMSREYRSRAWGWCNSFLIYLP